MRTLLLIILFSISLKSQWVYNTGYSISKESFENAEWRIYEGELQVHRNDSSYFYNIENLKLNDKLKVVDDTLKTDNGKYQLFDSKFDKVNYKINKNHIKIYDERNSDSIYEINMGDELRNIGFRGADIYFHSEEYYIFRSYNKLYIINNNNYGQIIITRSYFAYPADKLIVLIYDLDNKTIDIKKLYNIGNLTNVKINQFTFQDKRPKFYFSTEEGSFNWYSEYSIITRDYYKFDTQNDSLKLMIKNKDYVSKVTSINKNEEYNVEYNNYTFNSREIKNWENQTIDTNIRKYKARLIQEIIPNTYLMYSDSINYFIYNLIDNNLVVLDKLNDIHKKEQFSNEYVDEEKNLFYAETASHKIARVSLSSIVNNLISVDFAADKNMADSNYVFTFENKSVGEIEEYLWDFGDGNTSTEKNPKHKYENSGTYDITLTCSGAGQSTSNTKKGHIYIPTPVRLHVSHTMTLNEKDASFYVSSGATGSRLKYRLRTSPFNDLDEITTNPLIDTLEASSYSFTTNKSYFSRYFIFEVWNEMYSAYKYYNITDIEFDIWNKDLVEEKIINNKNAKLNLNQQVNNIFMLKNSVNEPITVIENNGYIHIDNMIDENKYYEINKEIELYSDYSFITKDNILYLVNLENNKNTLDSVDLNLIIGEDKIELYDNLDELNYALISETKIYIIDVYGNLINKFNRPNELPGFLKKINNTYYYGEKYYHSKYPGQHNIFSIIFFDKEFKRVGNKRINSAPFTSAEFKTFLFKEGDIIKIYRVQNKKQNCSVFEYTINMAINNNVSFNKYIHYLKPYYYYYNNKLLSIKDVIYHDIFSGYIPHTYTNLSISNILDSNLIYNYTFNERVGSMGSALYVNDYLYLFGLNYKGLNNGYKKVLWKLDLKDEMYLDVEEAKLGENKYIWDRLLKINTTSNFNTDYKLFNLLGEEIKKDNYRLLINKDNIEIEAISISKGIYKLQLGEQNFILLK